MTRGMYIATMGMLLDEARLNNVANNLANVDTTGYKKDRLAFRTYFDRFVYRIEPKPERGRNEVKHIGSLAMATILDEVRPDMTQGPTEYTGRKYHFAIDGEGFFKIGRGGNVYFTRNGHFIRDAMGRLTNSEGFFLLDENDNVIVVPNGAEVADDGTVRAADGTVLARIPVYTFANPERLTKYGYTCFLPTQTSGAPVLVPQSRLLVGYLEKSNVNPVKEMVDMIYAQRHYDISQRLITTTDTLLERLINDVGRTR